MLRIHVNAFEPLARNHFPIWTLCIARIMNCIKGVRIMPATHRNQHALSVHIQLYVYLIPIDFQLCVFVQCRRKYNIIVSAKEKCCCSLTTALCVLFMRLCAHTQQCNHKYVYFYWLPDTPGICLFTSAALNRESTHITVGREYNASAINCGARPTDFARCKYLWSRFQSNECKSTN